MGGWLQARLRPAATAALAASGLMAGVLTLLPTAAQADDTASADGLVHCQLPGQVRRLGAFSTTVTPRRTQRLTPAQCRAGGGEYVEPQDTGGALKMWLPMANEGLPEAQTTVGELFEQRGQNAMAKSWYEKAAALGDVRSLINLAGLLGQESVKGLIPLENFTRITQLVGAATGGLVAGLSIERTRPLRIEFVSPTGVAPLPRTSGGPLTVEAPSGPLEVVVRVDSPSGLKTVRVNGQDHTPDAQGLLTIPLTVGDERATLRVEAEDDTGAKAQGELNLVQRSAAPSPAAAASNAAALVAALDEKPVPSEAFLKGRRLALVIANQQYTKWTPLDTPHADARAVGEALKNRFGFDVTTLNDATRQQMLAALSRLRQQLGPQDQLVVYYAGHGQMDDVTARGYWIPVDGDTKDISQWVSVIDVTDQLSAMNARHVLVIADSCYSGTLTRSLVPSIDSALTLEQRLNPLRQLSKQRARVALTSGGLEPVVDGGSVQHSLFARSLLDVLGQVRGPVAAQELYQSVSARFAHLARRLKVPQQPQYAPIGFAGHEAGDFVLTPL